jgi:type VI secretion system secreted protein Hcp
VIAVTAADGLSRDNRSQQFPREDPMPVFLKYGQIKGDATEAGHRGWIELTSAQFGASRRIDSRDRERPRGSANISDITVTKNNDSASMSLQREALNGRPVTAFVDFVLQDGSVSLRLEMSGTMISSLSLSGGSDATETLTLNFTKIEITSTPGTPPP